MNISLRWLNTLLEPGNLTAAEADHVLTEAGFPIEETTILADGDTLLDVEVTSNRVDCLGHAGCAREVAASRQASTPRTLKLPEPALTFGAPIGDALTLDNRAHDGCPLFTARLIRNVKIGPSPDWLVQALESTGQRSINNVVDVTNYITYFWANPCHVFDHAKLAGGALIVRYAEAGERIKTLYEGEHELKPSDLVVADAERPQSLAGVIGGHDSQVDANTTTVVFEMATWHPVTIRTSARRMNINTDAAYRFQRSIHPGTIERAAAHAVALICEVSGGELAEDVLRAGPAMPAPVVVDLRPSRCAKILGIDTPAGDIIALLRALEVDVEQTGDDTLRCTVPPHRMDTTREIDLIEEVARTRGYGDIPAAERITLDVRPPQASELAQREIARVLTGQGFYETVTFSFTNPAAASDWLSEGLEAVAVDDDRRKAEPTLRPSPITGLLACRRANQDAGVEQPGGVRLFEIAESFAQRAGTTDTVERRTLALLMDAPGTGAKRSTEDIQHGLRVLRGAIEGVLRAMAGPIAAVTVEPAEPSAAAWDGAGFGRIQLNGAEVGVLGPIAGGTLKRFGVDLPALAAELDMESITAPYPPRSSAAPLPAFPAIERDLSLILPEATRWAQVEAVVRGAEPALLEHVGFVGVFRGKQVGGGKKSLTLRMRFRDPERTLRHEEVDPQVAAVVEAAKSSLAAELRG